MPKTNQATDRETSSSAGIDRIPKLFEAPLSPPAAGRLQLEDVLAWLRADGLISETEANNLHCLARIHARVQTELHPLIWLSEHHLKSSRPPREELNLERLTLWLAERAGLPYRRIDPLQIDVDAITTVVPKAYAQRKAILPVEVDATRVVFATAEPHDRAWEAGLQHALNREIQRVIANPRDIARYQEEFFGLSQSLLGARNSEDPAAHSPGIGNLEALVELGRAGKLDANDRHLVSIVDWLLQYAFEQRASDIHIEPRRDNGSIRFRIGGDLHTIYEMPTPILGAVTARIKAVGRMDIVDKRRPRDGRAKTKTPSGQEVEPVLSTLHTNDAASTVTRLLDIGVPPYLINATVLGVAVQRLARTLCPYCKTPASVDAELWRELTRPWTAEAPQQAYAAVGCLECRKTGFLGRVGLYEILRFTPEIRKPVNAVGSLNELRKQGLRLNGAAKVCRGLTTVDEVMRVTPSIEAV